MTESENLAIRAIATKRLVLNLTIKGAHIFDGLDAEVKLIPTIYHPESPRWKMRVLVTGRVYFFLGDDKDGVIDLMDIAPIIFDFMSKHGGIHSA